MVLDGPALARRDSDSGGKLSRSTIITIAVVAGSVVVLIFALFLWRNLARSCRRGRKVPLPPVQDLAHHREQQLAAFTDRAAASRPATWVDPPRAYSTHFLSASASNASLIRHSPDFSNTSRSPTRENSWAVEDATSAESSPYPTPLSTDDLRAPNPSYFPPGPGLHPHNSMASVASDSSDALATSPSEPAPSTESAASLVAHARPRPPRASRSRSRPLSLVSAAGTTHSLQAAPSVNTLRGPAHSIHSSIQIVLPAPLAPELYPAVRTADDRISVVGMSMSRAPSFYGGEGDRRSVADPWLSGRTQREGSSGSSSRMSSVGPRPASAPRPRSSLHKVASSSSLSSRSDSASTRARRAQSQPPAGSSLPPSRAPSPGPSRPQSAAPAPLPSPPPPVPRIPSMYGIPGASRAPSAPEESPVSAGEGELGREGRPPARGRAQRSSWVPPPGWDPLVQGAPASGAALPPVMEYATRAGHVDRPPMVQEGHEMSMRPEGAHAQRRPSKLRKQRSVSRGGKS